MGLVKINLILQNLILSAAVIFFSGCVVGGYKPKLSANQETAKIDYSPYRSGTLFLAEDIKCSSLFGFANNEREVTPVIFAKDNFHLDAAATIPTSDNQVFLATTDTLVGNNRLKLWFKFPVKANKLYKVYAEKTLVEKKLLNFDRYKYNSYEYNIKVVDELNQPIAIESIPSPDLDPECDSGVNS